MSSLNPTNVDAVIAESRAYLKRRKLELQNLKVNKATPSVIASKQREVDGAKRTLETNLSKKKGGKRKKTLRARRSKSRRSTVVRRRR